MAKVALGILIFLFLIVLFVRSPWGQEIIKDQLVSFISNKTNTKVEVERLFITFDGDIQVDGLFLEDKQGDTLIYSKSLEANIALWDMIRGRTTSIDGLDWTNVRANIKRKDTITGFNYEFLLDVFPTASADSTTVAQDSVAPQAPFLLGDFDFKNFNIVYNDAVVGIESRYVFDRLEGEDYEMDIIKMQFNASDFNLTNASINVTQFPVPEDPNGDETPLPSFVVDAIALNNVKVDFKSEKERMALDADISELYAEVPRFEIEILDLQFDELILKNSKVALHTETIENAVTEKIIEVAEEAQKDIQTFEWPEYRFDFNNFSLENNTFQYVVGNQKIDKSQFNPNAFRLTNLNLKGSSIEIGDKSANTIISDASFNSNAGYVLHRLAINANLDDKELNAKSIDVALNRNRINGSVNLKYPSISALIESPEESQVHFNFQNFKLYLEDVLPFQPQLRNNTYFVELTEKPITGSVNAYGKLSNIEIPKLNVQWGNSTKIVANGNLQNPMNPDDLRFRLVNITAKTKKEDIKKFMPTDSLSINLPTDIKLTGNIAGSLNAFNTNLKLTTNQGIAKVNGAFTNDETINFDANISIQNYKLDQLLDNPRLGGITATIDAKGFGQDINTLDADITAVVDSFALNNYDIRNLKIDGTIENGQGNITSKYKDDNLNMVFDGAVVLDSIAPEITMELNVIGADLEGLGFMTRDVRTGFTLYADFKGDLDSYDVASVVEDGVVVYDNQTYLLGDINAIAHVRPDTTSVSLSNKIVTLDLKSNTDPSSFSNSLQQHISSYFYRDIILPDTIVNPVNLNMKGYIAQAPLLNEVFLVNINDLDTINFDVNFIEKERKFKARIKAPHINYSGYEIDSLAFSMNTDHDKFNFNFGFREINAGPLKLPKSIIKGEQISNEMHLDFLAYYDGKEMMNVKADITGNRDRLRFHVNPENLTLNRAKWNSPNDNEIIITENNLDFNNFRIDKNGQSISIIDDKPGISKSHIAIDFKNFQLTEVLDYLNPEEKLAKGILSGDLIIQEPFKETGLVTNLSIAELELMDVDMGTLTMNGNVIGRDTYNIKMSTKGGDVDLDVSGNYVGDVDATKLNLDVSINNFKMKALKGFSRGSITDGTGDFTGEFSIKGNTTDAIYQGHLNFTNAGFKIAQLNSTFLLENERLNINDEILSMDNFTIRDYKNNEMVLSGNIGIESYLNPTFDLNISAQNFQLLNATKEDNELFYGTANVDATASIKGDLDIPIINLTANVDANTDFTYVMPSATVNIEERDGIVVFVNRENPDAILTRTEEQTATVKGFQINANLTVNDDAAVTIVLDQSTGDNIQVSGDGDFNFRMKPNGSMNLVGIYEIVGGHYEMNLYSLVNRRFEIADGSRVSWSGDPFDAKLDVKAIYKVETSASGLMAPASSGISATQRGRYRQVLPFYVYLNIDGELMAPKISFDLDMPEDEQGALGGQVFGRVQQINNQEDELNRQVFSLLVLNRFYPEGNSDGTNGGVATIARDNLNDALSDQLNVFSDKIFGNAGFNLDFNLDSFTDYQGETPQDRTQLDIAAQKKLFDDRLTVRVGSEVDLQGTAPVEESNPLIGNVSLEYSITEDGRYRLRGFRRNEFENVIDGQTIVTGIALIFTQEFNKFNELWDALFHSQTKKEKQQEKEEDKAEDKIDAREEDVNKSMEEKKIN